MAKYLILWQIDGTKVPVSPQERAAMWDPFMSMVEQDLKTGISKDWGSYVGELRGFSIAEGTEVEIGNMLQRYVPYVQFEVHPVMPTRQVRQVIKALSQ
ncbi:MAG TPA: hypothetical protein VEG28_01055 [Dehalococcoidia bacterium]|nr:hypothetical protein [Dehalococcoidia bacterium]